MTSDHPDLIIQMGKDSLDMSLRYPNANDVFPEVTATLTSKITSSSSPTELLCDRQLKKGIRRSLQLYVRKRDMHILSHTFFKIIQPDDDLRYWGQL